MFSNMMHFFVYGHHIQALLEERFVSNFGQSEEHSSLAAREFGQLGQYPLLSGLRYVILFI